MSFLKEQLPLLKAFLLDDLPRTLRYSTRFFVISVFLGFGLYLFDPTSADQILDEFAKMVLEAGVINEETGEISVFALLQNNWIAMMTMMLYGFLPFLFLPAVSLFSNGVLIGVLAGVYWYTEGLDLGMYLAGILPHGIFEIPALLLSSACGVYLCFNTCKVILNKQPIPMVKLIGDLLRVLLFVVAPLTVAAAFIEAYVTPLVQAVFM